VVVSLHYLFVTGTYGQPTAPLARPHSVDARVGLVEGGITQRNHLFTLQPTGARYGGARCLVRLQLALPQVISIAAVRAREHPHKAGGVVLLKWRSGMKERTGVTSEECKCEDCVSVSVNELSTLTYPLAIKPQPQRQGRTSSSSASSLASTMSRRPMLRKNIQK
jgi:hypothetical protein